jgi:hypothetical protein
MAGTLTVPVNGTSTTVPQTLVFDLRNLGYYFGKIKRENIVENLKRQTTGYSGCLLTIYFGGVQVFQIDIADLPSNYQSYSSNPIVPSLTNTTIQFVETCQNTNVFPTLDVANVTIVYPAVSSSSFSSGPSSTYSPPLMNSSPIPGSSPQSMLSSLSILWPSTYPPSNPTSSLIVSQATSSSTAVSSSSPLFSYPGSLGSAPSSRGATVSSLPPMSSTTSLVLC